MASLGDQIARWGSLLLGFIGDEEQQRAQDEATAANRRREREIRSGYRGLRSRTLAPLGQQQLQQRRRLARLRDQYAGEIRKLNEQEQRQLYKRKGARLSEYDKVVSDALGSLVGVEGKFDADSAAAIAELLGVQERGRGYIDALSGQEYADLDQDYAEREASIMQDLSRRGLTGVTGGTAKLGVEREKRGARNRLADLLLREKLDFETGIGSELARTRLGAATTRADIGGRTASARERLGLGRVNLADLLDTDIINAARRGGESRINTQQQYDLALSDLLAAHDQERRKLDIDLTLSELGFIEGIEDEYPDTNAFLQLSQGLGRNIADEPHQPSTASQLVPGFLQAGGQLGSAAILGGLL